MVKESMKILKEIFVRKEISTPELERQTGKKQNYLHVVCDRLISRGLAKKSIRTVNKFPIAKVTYWFVADSQKARAIRKLREAELIDESTNN